MPAARGLDRIHCWGGFGLRRESRCTGSGFWDASLLIEIGLAVTLAGDGTVLRLGGQLFRWRVPLACSELTGPWMDVAVFRARVFG